MIQTVQKKTPNTQCPQVLVPLAVYTAEQTWKPCFWCCSCLFMPYSAILGHRAALKWTVSGGPLYDLGAVAIALGGQTPGTLWCHRTLTLCALSPHVWLILLFGKGKWNVLDKQPGQVEQVKQTDGYSHRRRFPGRKHTNIFKDSHAVTRCPRLSSAWRPPGTETVNPTLRKYLSYLVCRQYYYLHAFNLYNLVWAYANCTFEAAFTYLLHNTPSAVQLLPRTDGRWIHLIRARAARHFLIELTIVPTGSSKEHKGASGCTQ